MKIYKQNRKYLDEVGFIAIGLSGLFASYSMAETTTLLNGTTVGKWNYFSLQNIKTNKNEANPLMCRLFERHTYWSPFEDKNEPIW